MLIRPGFMKIISIHYFHFFVIDIGCVWDQDFMFCFRNKLGPVQFHDLVCSIVLVMCYQETLLLVAIICFILLLQLFIHYHSAINQVFPLSQICLFNCVNGQIHLCLLYKHPNFVYWLTVHRNDLLYMIF